MLTRFYRGQKVVKWYIFSTSESFLSGLLGSEGVWLNKSYLSESDFSSLTRAFSCDILEFNSSFQFQLIGPSDMMSHHRMAVLIDVQNQPKNLQLLKWYEQYNDSRYRALTPYIEIIFQTQRPAYSAFSSRQSSARSNVSFTRNCKQDPIKNNTK